MKVFQIVGVRGSGKTTTAERLIKAFRRRGLRVGTVKSVGCPAFTLDPDGGTGTARHRRAGAEVTVAAGRRETDVMYGRALEPETLFRHLAIDGLDLAVVEGAYAWDLPRVVCLKNLSELAERRTEKTFAVAGVLAGAAGAGAAIAGLPAFGTEEAADALADLVLGTVPEIAFPVGRLPRPASSRVCAGACRVRRGRAGEQKQNGNETGGAAAEEAGAVAEEGGADG